MKRYKLNRKEGVKLLYLLLSLAIFLFFLSLLPVGKGKLKDIEIKEGASLLLIAEKLKSEGLIRSKFSFILLALLTGKGKKLKAGFYELSSSFPSWKILGILAEGKVKKIKVTIPEGFNIRQIGERLEQAGIISAKEFVSLATNAPLTLRVIVSAPSGNLEGFLFPDTYFFSKGESPENIVKAMLWNFRKKVLEKIEGSSELPFYDALKLASLVEWEAKHNEERRLIAGVLLNRLKKGMRLECDATVQYVLPQHKRRITYKDLEIDSPYNTYKVKGLPPTPICNPGLPSIEAALNPEDTPFLFYVARPDGYHIFSLTAEEHFKAVERARKLWQGEKG
jgi:UPF0755 protein